MGDDADEKDASRLDRLIDEQGGRVGAFLVLGPVLIGAYPVTGLLNPFWGSLFGFPLHLAAAGHPVYGPHPWTELAAFLFWPIAMIALMTWAAGRLLASTHRWRNAAVVLWAASAFAVVPMERAFTLFAGWPIYGPFE